jgi:hypothetical protein
VRAGRSALIAIAVAVIAIGALGLFARPIGTPDATRVVAVYAGGGDVPSNLLRMYVEFSAPMEPGRAYQNIHLFASDGHEINDAFLELREELWTPDCRRLTVLFDPGRLKRGIRSNDEMGAPLRAGQRYRLVIDPAWRDARNRPLGMAYVQELRVAGFDSVMPDPSQWSISAPRAHSRDTLRVGFGEALDHALALRMIAVVDSAGSRLPGIAALSAGDRGWTFVPAARWRLGARLRVEPGLEDLAGNNLVRPFDADRRGGGRTAEASVADTTPRLVALLLR